MFKFLEMEDLVTLADGKKVQIPARQQEQVRKMFKRLNTK